MFNQFAFRTYVARASSNRVTIQNIYADENTHTLLYNKSGRGRFRAERDFKFKTHGKCRFKFCINITRIISSIQTLINKRPCKHYSLTKYLSIALKITRKLPVRRDK